MKQLTFHKSELPINIKVVEEKYNATFVGDFCIKGTSGYTTDIAAIFWQETPPEDGYSNYFALLLREGSLYIASGASAFEAPIYGVVADDGEVVYSRHRHDYRISADGSAWIDGGRDYVRTSVDARMVEIVVDGPCLFVKKSAPKETVSENGEEEGTPTLKNPFGGWTDGPKWVCTTQPVDHQYPKHEHINEFIGSIQEIDQFLDEYPHDVGTFYIVALQEEVEPLIRKYPYRDIHWVEVL